MILEKFRLDEKVALVTGASRGIGRSIALGMAEAGAEIVLCARNLDPLRAVAQEIERLGRKALPIPCHVERAEEVDPLVTTAFETFGRLDTVVNSAVVPLAIGPTLAVSETYWQENLDVNLKGVFLVCRAAAERLRQSGGGSIINVSSVAGVRGLGADPAKGFGVYAMAKAGLNMLTQVLANELGPDGIRVNTIAPGLIRTERSGRIWKDEGELRKRLDKQAIKRLGVPEDIAAAAIYLASEAGSFVTGALLLVDGGIAL
jgi:NAD(P)-dependent dehydrogenase (short-subunit alcohol dehydrogenase family)